MIKKWKVLQSKKIFSSPFVTLKEEELKRPDGKVVSPYYVVGWSNVVYIVAVTKNKGIVLVHQYKNGVKDLVWELPAGFIDKGEAPREAAKRELLEETGFVGGKLTEIGRFRSNQGLTNYISHFFFVDKAEKVSNQNLDENEEIEVKVYPVDKVIEDIRNNKSIISDMHSQFGILLAKELL
ncbi:MAG: hypothetical protein A2864_02205 [Candidatus Woykebacteria bacterium RIFCSPHIGHO2_01_FULL_39_12]|uniref:Nudix hydrolase domain-containing protein n=2 Tax=Candidatus Woykeibacteriota TaxID=1817899 RepID=A0A1G1WEE6_9BACT|nr:MAG: hypothetical protein A2134_02890 [Candidatus Woykebacteria bacterium RBG_16_39_9b]OGY27667.1 MAG: hypothetical protein A2864_02205 [Candidatus Woykebacteria bacterium RIFCSPHIGHO2_01_FULL_39_12]